MTDDNLRFLMISAVLSLAISCDTIFVVIYLAVGYSYRSGVTAWDLAELFPVMERSAWLVLWRKLAELDLLNKQ